MNALLNLLKICFNLLRGEKRDYFLTYKFDLIKSYYGKLVLDVGAGRGHFSRFLSLQQHQVTSIDVVDLSDNRGQIQLFDGANLPFDDHSFDTILFHFVLHHSETQFELLKEAKRVCRGHIILAEDTMENGFDKIMGNIHLNTSPWSKAENGFHSDKEWQSIFRKFDLELVKKLEIPRSIYPVYPVSRYMYVLKPHHQSA